MFDDVLRELDRMSRGFSIQVEAPVDDAGYFDRLCPSAECGNVFKVLVEDWKAKVPDDKAYCAFCRHEAEPSEFNTPEQNAYFAAAAQAAVMNQLTGAFQSSAQAFNRQQSRGFITLQLRVDAPAVQVPVPPDAEEAMTLRITCEACGCRYAVVGAGYFCPACGHNSADTTFDQSVARARNAIAALPDIKAALTDRDAAVQVAQNLIEGTFGNLVTAFQYFAAAIYLKLPAPKASLRRNAFQNLAEGSRLWHEAGGRTYSAILNADEMAELTLLFQQRHVLQHSQGIIDPEYLDRSGDATYVLGQRIVVRESSVLRLADVLTILVAGMRADIDA